MIYVGKSYTATVSGTRLVDVACEQCRSDFVYELVRDATGHASAPYFIGTGSGPKRAQKNATKRLARRLATEAEMVPCPKCGWINESLVVGYRRTRYKWLLWFGLVGGIALAISVLLTQTADRKFHADTDLPGSLLASAIAFVAVAAPALLLRRWLRRRIQPNRMYPQRPTLPEGTPAAQLKSEWLAGTPTLPAVDDRFVPADVSSTAYPDWAVFRVGQFDLPLDVCCECAAPATKRLTQWFKVNASSDPIQPPVCAECASRLRASWLMWASVSTLALVGASFAFYVFAGGDEVGRIVLASMVGAFGLIFTLMVIPNRVTQPYKLRQIDSARGIWAIRFRDERFTERVRKACQRAAATGAIRPVSAPLLTTDG